MIHDVNQLRERLREGVRAVGLAEEQGRLETALALAERAHAGQTRKMLAIGGTPPYLTHPLRVALILLEEARVADAASICAAVLHDAVEDSAGRVTRADIETQVGPEVAELVAVLTKPAGGNPDLKDYYAGLRRASPAARLIKLADRLDNVREAVLTADAPFHRKYTAETREVYLPLAEGTVLEGALREAYEDLAEVVGVGSMTARL